jgi:signal transduction histidine kinase
MTDLTPLQLASVTLNVTAAVVWGSVARREWETLRAYRPRTPLFRLLRNMAALGAVHFALQAVVCLTPPAIAFTMPPPFWLRVVYIAADWSLVLIAPVAWHLTRHWGAEADPPGRIASTVTYGSAVLVMATTVFFPVWFGGFANPLLAYLLLRNAYMITLFALTVGRMMRVRRHGRWRPGAAANAVIGADVLLFGGGIALMALVLGLVAIGGLPDQPSLRSFLIDAGIAVLVTTPIAARELTHVVRALLLASSVIAVTAVTFFASRAVVPYLIGPQAVRTADVATVLAIVAVGLPAQALMRHAIDRVILRRRAHLWNDLRTFLATLSPELGATTCCRRALAETVRVLGLTGAAILLRDGETIVEGTFDVEPLRRSWPRGEALDALPPAFVTLDYLDELPRPAIDALIESEVIAVLPIVSPRCRWGALFATSGPLEPVPEEGDAVEAFVAQLALLLDAAALIERTVAVERALAHAEKLAAIGELAARIAHEIRNPITAARSLAQLLARDPTAPENTEYAGLILGELERVEAQVRGLLQFARREEYRFEPVDLAELVQVTLGPMRHRLDEAAVVVDASVRPGVVVRADREKLRQVLANLVDNAVDAVAASPPADRRLAIGVATENGTARLEVRDSGPGIPEDARGRIFEPFFSGKPNGTGLGLAIARRTVEAHGGRIAAEPAAPHGTVFRVELPTHATIAS